MEILSVEGAPAAFALYQQVADEAEILTLGVLPDCRRQGYGRRLLKAGIDYFRHRVTQTIFLEVGQNNLDARHLYATVGFLDAGRRGNYYRHENGLEDAILMKYSI